MKIIEAMKQVKDLTKKAEDLRGKIGKFSAYLSLETPTYPDQKEQVESWLQAHSDLLKEIIRLRVAIQRTNLQTQVTVKLGDVEVTKSIAEWIHRRRDLAGLEQAAWSALTDRNLREQQGADSMGNQIKISIVRCYDAKQRDAKISLYSSEPTTIDGKLEVVNAVTDLIEEDKVLKTSI